MKRRQFLAALPAAGLAPVLVSAQEGDSKPEASGPLLTSPPVVQRLFATGFAVSIRVSRMATGWVEWGTHPDKLDQKAIATLGGLIDADDIVLRIPVSFSTPQPAGSSLYYRVCAQSLKYINAYKLERGETESTEVRSLRIPDPAARSIHLVALNDTHNRKNTIAELAKRIEKTRPQHIIWNGDACDYYNTPHDPADILLTPGMEESPLTAGGWASTRALWFSPGNHDTRGERARDLYRTLAVDTSSALPWNVAFRDGPLAIIVMDTGEDKPDAHPVFGGTAAYERYREAQAEWLKKALARPEIASATFKIVFCHIPLHGLPDHNPGTTMEGFAGYCGFAAPLWLPLMRQAGVQAIVSGHTHRWRIDDPTDEFPFLQIVGGGPQPERAAPIFIEATEESLSLRLEDLQGNLLDSRTIKAKA